MKLTLHSKIIQFELGELVTNFIHKLDGLNYVKSEFLPNFYDFELNSEGVSFQFADGVLETVFLFIAREDPDKGVFNGKIDLIDDLFWKFPTRTNLNKILSKTGFESVIIGKGVGREKLVKKGVFVDYYISTDERNKELCLETWRSDEILNSSGSNIV